MHVHAEMNPTVHETLNTKLSANDDVEKERYNYCLQYVLLTPRAINTDMLGGFLLQSLSESEAEMILNGERGAKEQILTNKFLVSNLSLSKDYRISIR